MIHSITHLYLQLSVTVYLICVALWLREIRITYIVTGNERHCVNG